MSHLCADGGGRGQVLGEQLLRPVGRRHDDETQHAGGRGGLASGVGRMAAGYGHTCALTAGGGVKCWGCNGCGQLGDGTTTSRSTPVDVVGLASGVAAIAAGGDAHLCADGGGRGQVLGEQQLRPVGRRHDDQCLTPVDVVGLASGVAAHGGGLAAHLCADGGGRGQVLGVTTTTASWATARRRTAVTPVDVVGLASGVAAIAAGGYTPVR